MFDDVDAHPGTAKLTQFTSNEPQRFDKVISEVQ
jgi:hypothetical protein